MKPFPGRAHYFACLLATSATMPGMLAVPAHAAGVSRASFNIPASDLRQALRIYIAQSGAQVLYSDETVRGSRSTAISGSLSNDQALALLLRNSGMEAHRGNMDVWIIRRARASRPLLISAAANQVVVQPEVPAVAVASTRNADTQAAPEIVVTAQRRAQRLQDVPVSLTVINGEALQQRGITSLRDLSSQVGGLQISPGPASDQLQLRGLGSGFNVGFEQSVATFVDNVYRPRSRATRIALFDIERVEVLKGPQTTFFGANAIAGALNITTPRPVLGRTSGNASALYSVSDDELGLEVGLSFPLTPTLATRIAGRVSKPPKYIYNERLDREGPSETDAQGRISTLWRPNDQVSVEARADFARLRGTGTSNYEVVGCPPSGAAAAGQCARALGLFGGEIDDDLNYVSDAGPSRLRLNLFEAALTPTIKIGGHRFIATTSFARQNVTSTDDVVPLPGQSVLGTPYFPFFRGERFRQITQEARLESPTNAQFEYMLGAYYENGKLSNDQRLGFFFAPFANGVPGITTPFAPVASFVRSNQDSRTYSVFGSVLFRPAPALTLTLGGRYSRVTKEAHTANTIGASNNDVSALSPFPVASQAILASILGLAAGDYAKTKIKNTSFMPSAKVQYAFTPNVMAYGSYAKGFKAGGFDPSGGAVFDPETVDAFELGLKSSLLDRRLTINVAVFNSNYKDLQEASVLLLPSGAASNRVTNAARSRSRGVEIDTSLRAIRWLTLSASAAYLKATYTRYTNATCTADQIALLPRGAACSQDLSGRTRAFAPKFSGSVSADVKAPLSSQLVAHGGASLQFSSRFFQQNVISERLMQPAYAKLDLRAGFGAENRAWDLVFIARNVTNRRTANLRAVLSGSGSSIIALADRPRSFAIQATAQW